MNAFEMNITLDLLKKKKKQQQQHAYLWTAAQTPALVLEVVFVDDHLSLTQN